MLRNITIDKKENGHRVNVPTTPIETKIDQYIKQFIETADYNLQDASGAISLFRGFHGEVWTMRIIDAILNELRHATIQLDISSSRDELVPFFEDLRQRHAVAPDEDFGYPHQDRSILPL